MGTGVIKNGVSEPGFGQGSFQDLRWVFARTGTRLLAADEEWRLAESMWQSRRRLCRAKVWQESGRSGLPPQPRAHRRPFSPRMRRRLLAAEREARAAADGAARDALSALVASELRKLDETRDQLFRHNVRLVAWVAKGFLGKGLDLLDLFQEGSMALLFSIDRFDPARNVRLSSYATHAVRLGMMRALAERGRTVRIPTYRFKEVVATAGTRRQLLESLGREPTPDELERHTELPRRKLDELLAATRPLVSLDAPVEGREGSVGENLVSDAGISPADEAESSETRERAARALEQLSTRHRRILEMRYGLADDTEHSYETIGRTLGISRERTRQLELSARERMRKLLLNGTS